MTDTLTIGETPVNADELDALTSKLREDGHDRIAEEIETARQIGLKRMQVNSAGRDAVMQALRAADS